MRLSHARALGNFLLDQVSSEAVTVLLVDDDALVHEVIRLALEDGGFEVLSAATGTEAIALLDARHTSIHALVTDINLGRDVDGWAVAQHARELQPRLPVVYVTGDSGYEWRSHGVPESVVIEKPFVAAQIVTAVAAARNDASG